MKKCIYSVITNGFDVLSAAPNYPGWDSIMFMDEMPKENKGWEIREISKSTKPTLKSRSIKILSHVWLQEYDLVCYVDANQLIRKAPPERPTWFRHPRRTNIFEEAAQIIKNGRFTAEEINPQIECYKSQGYEDRGLYLNGFFVRSNNDEDINILHNIWYEETARYSPRDQLSLPFAVWKTGVEPENIQPIRLKADYAIVKYPH